MGRALLFILSGPSGVGKASVLHGVLERLPDLRKVVTYTTRSPRAHEVPGFDYHFVGRDEFFAMVADGRIQEYERVYGDDYFYGSPAFSLDEGAGAGRAAGGGGEDGGAGAAGGGQAGDTEGVSTAPDRIVELDYKGFRKYRQRYAGSTVAIFLVPPSLGVLERRINNRGRVDNLAARLANAVEQLRYAGEYDYVVVNEDLDECVDTVAAIVRAERCRRDRGELLRFVEGLVAGYSRV